MPDCPAAVALVPRITRAARQLILTLACNQGVVAHSALEQIGAFAPCEHAATVVAYDEMAPAEIAGGQGVVVRGDLDAADAGQCPTLWQRSTYPERDHSMLRVMHEGVDTEVLRPDGGARLRVAVESGATAWKGSDIESPSPPATLPHGERGESQAANPAAGVLFHVKMMLEV